MLGGGWVVNHIEIRCMVKRQLLRGFSLYIYAWPFLAHVQRGNGSKWKRRSFQMLEITGRS
jgi:hypothetical protein